LGGGPRGLIRGVVNTRHSTAKYMTWFDKYPRCLSSRSPYSHTTAVSADSSKSISHWHLSRPSTIYQLRFSRLAPSSAAIWYPVSFLCLSRSNTEHPSSTSTFVEIGRLGDRDTEHGSESHSKHRIERRLLIMLYLGTVSYLPSSTVATL
jgi:hypothetical protein